MRIKFQSFPDYLAPDEEKDTKEYGLKMGQAIQYEWFKKADGGVCSYYNRRAQYHNLRLYGRGEQDTSIYKKMLSSGKTSYTNFDWRPLQIIPKYVKLMVNQMTERLYEINISATDNYSTNLKNTHREYLERVAASKDTYKIAQQAFGVNIAPPNVEELPNTKEEVQLWMDMEYKPAIEAATQTALKFTFDVNDYDETQSRILEDITVIGIGAAKHTTDPTKGIKIKYIDPANLVYSFPDSKDFKNIHYIGEVERMTINELDRICDEELTKDDIRNLANNSRDWNSYHGNARPSHESGDLAGMMVDILRFTFKTTNTITYKKKNIKSGGFNMTKKASTFAKKKGGGEDGYDVVSKKIDIWYEGSMVLGTDIIFGYKKCENMVRPKGLLNETMSNYAIYAPEIYQNRTVSLVSRIIPYVDQMQQIHIKIQQLVAKARPNGIYIDIDGLSEVDLGDGNILTPLELVKIYDETGNLIGTSLNSEGEYNYGKEPIKELRNGVVEGIEKFINLYNQYLNQLRDAIGIPAGADASAPRADLAVGVQQQMALNSNTATRHIADGSVKITNILASGISLRMKDIFKYSNLKELYTNAVGKMGFEVMKSMEDFSLYDMAIIISMKPDAEEKAYLEQNIQVALSKELIELTDAINIRSIGNIKIANKVLEIKCRQRAKEKQEQALAMVEANAKAQIESNNAAAQSKLELSKAEVEGKIALEMKKGEMKESALKLEAQLKSDLMEKEFDYNMRLKGIDMEQLQNSEKTKEDNKFKLQGIRDTNDSKKIEQKKFNQPAMSFESSEDNLSGSMDMSEMNVT